MEILKYTTSECSQLTIVLDIDVAFVLFLFPKGTIYSVQACYAVARDLVSTRFIAEISSQEALS